MLLVTVQSFIDIDDWQAALNIKFGQGHRDPVAASEGNRLVQPAAEGKANRKSVHSS
jgi:hypothetical protein